MAPLITVLIDTQVTKNNNNIRKRSKKEKFLNLCFHLFSFQNLWRWWRFVSNNFWYSSSSRSFEFSGIVHKKFSSIFRVKFFTLKLMNKSLIYLISFFQNPLTSNSLFLYFCRATNVRLLWVKWCLRKFCFSFLKFFFILLLAYAQ